MPSVTKLTHLENEEAEFKFKNGPDRNRPMTLIPNLNSCFSTIQKKALLMIMNLRDFAGDEYRDDTHDDDKHETWWWFIISRTMVMDYHYKDNGNGLPLQGQW